MGTGGARASFKRRERGTRALKGTVEGRVAPRRATWPVWKTVPLPVLQGAKAVQPRLTSAFTPRAPSSLTLTSSLPPTFLPSSLWGQLKWVSVFNPLSSALTQFCWFCVVLSAFPPQFLIV